MLRPERRPSKHTHTSEEGIASSLAGESSRQPSPSVPEVYKRAVVGVAHNQPRRRAFVGMHRCGRQTSISVSRRPPILTEKAHCLALKDPDSNKDAKGNSRGVKRSYADDGTEREAVLWGCSVATGNDQNEIQKLSQCSDSARPIVDRQLDSRVLISGCSSHKMIYNPNSDGSEEAEIRAEILNGVRHLLRDESEVDCLVRLCALLKEKNTALLERVIHRRGVAECAELLEETLQLEASGGMLTKDGRRRTPGGVFLRLLQDRIPQEDKRFIWDEQNREQRKLKRQRIRRQRTANAELWPYIENKGSAVPSAAMQHEIVTPVCDEREPGELDAAEMHALDEHAK